MAKSSESQFSDNGDGIELQPTEHGAETPFVNYINVNTRFFVPHECFSQSTELSMRIETPIIVHSEKENNDISSSNVYRKSRTYGRSCSSIKTYQDELTRPVESSEQINNNYPTSTEINCNLSTKLENKKYEEKSGSCSSWIKKSKLMRSKYEGNYGNQLSSSSVTDKVNDTSDAHSNSVKDNKFGRKLRKSIEDLRRHRATHPEFSVKKIGKLFETHCPPQVLKGSSTRPKRVDHATKPDIAPQVYCRSCESIGKVSYEEIGQYLRDLINNESKYHKIETEHETNSKCYMNYFTQMSNIEKNASYDLKSNENSSEDPGDILVNQTTHKSNDVNQLTTPQNTNNGYPKNLINCTSTDEKHFLNEKCSSNLARNDHHHEETPQNSEIEITIECSSNMPVQPSLQNSFGSTLGIQVNSILHHPVAPSSCFDLPSTSRQPMFSVHQQTEESISQNYVMPPEFLKPILEHQQVRETLSNNKNRESIVLRSNEHFDKWTKEFEKQNSVIAEASNALHFMEKQKKYYEMIERVEAERVLLIAGVRREVCLQQMNKVENGGTCEPKHGRIRLSNIIIPLTWKSKCSTYSRYFVCIFRCGTTILATNLLNSNRENQLKIEDSLSFDDVPVDSEITFQVYSLYAKIPTDKTLRWYLKACSKKLLKNFVSSRRLIPIRREFTLKQTSFISYCKGTIKTTVTGKKEFEIHNMFETLPLADLLMCNIESSTVKDENCGYLMLGENNLTRRG